mgnify:CR=1 FL=1
MPIIPKTGIAGSRLPELWPSLSNPQKKELLRSLIQRVIIRRPALDQVAVRVVWISGYFSDHTALTPIWREKDVSGFDQMAECIHKLCQQGYNDEYIAQHLSEKGFHSARLPYVTPTSVLKIRLARGWHTPFEQCRGKDRVGDYLTVNGLTKELGTDESTIYRYIYRKIIPEEFVTRTPQTGVYLIHNDERLIERLRQRVKRNKRRNGMRKSPESP